MPTNVSTPIWACDVCGTRFDDRLDVAQACEAGAVPDVATVELSCRGGQFHLVRLNDPVLHTRMNVWNFGRDDQGGHYWTYKVEDDNGSFRIDGDALVPGTAGRVQVPSSRKPGGVLWAQGETLPAGLDFHTLAMSAGLAVNGRDDVRNSRDSWTSWRWVGPITDEVREVFDALEVRICLDRGSVERNAFRRRNHVMAWLDGTIVSTPYAKTDYQLRHHGTVLDEMFAAWDAWWNGADIRVPNPPIMARSSRTASKLTKPLREMTERLGVPWEKRTAATDYARDVMFEKLGVKVENQSKLFDGLPIVAVGGVRGGVGKSTCSRWLAAGLAKRGERVLLLDLDLTSPTQHFAFGLTDGVRVNDERLRILAEPVDGGFCVFSVGQFGSDAALPQRWAEKDVSAFIEFIGSTLDVSGFDRIVADLPAGDGIERAILATSYKVNLTDEVLVTTADPHALAAAQTAIRRILHENHRRILVENQATATGTDSDGREVTVRLRGDGTEVPRLADETRTAFAGALPWVADGAVPDQIETLVDLVAHNAAPRGHA